MPQLPDGDIAQRAITAVSQFKNRVNNENQDQHDLFVECYELYSIKSRQTQIEPWLSKLKPTAAFEFVERAFSELVANTPSFEVVASTPGIPKIELEAPVFDDPNLGGNGELIREPLMIDFAEIYESDLDQMFKIRAMKKFLRSVIKTCLIYGTSHTEIALDVVSRQEYEQLFEDEEPVSTTIIEKVTPKPILIENFDVLVSPFAECPEDAIDIYGGYGVTRNNVSLRDLDEDTYGNLDMLKEVLTSNGVAPGEEKEEKDRVVSPNAEREIADTFSVDEVWMWFKEDEESEPKKMIISTASGVLIRYEEAKDVPFVVMKDHDLPSQYWGIGEVEPIKEDLYEETTLRNQRIDFNNRLLNEEWLVKADSGIDTRQLVSKPHNIIFGEDISDTAIRQVRRNTSALATSGEDIDRTRRNMSVTLSSTDTLATTGKLGGDTKTATGEKIREQNSISRFNAKAENIEFAIAEIARKMLEIKAENLDNNEKVPVFVRGKWREVSTKLYKENLSKHIISVRGGSMNVTNSEAERNNKIAAKNIAIEARNLGEQVNLTDLYKNLLGDFKGVDVAKVFPTTAPQSQAPASPLQPPGQPPQLPGQQQPPAANLQELVNQTQ